MSEKLYLVQINSKGMPNFSTAVEVADRPQGEWVKDEYDIPHCSECNCINNTVYRNYCPNCGAKMKGAAK